MTHWLIDTSALARLGATSAAPVWAERIDRGLVHISTVTRLEVGYSARSGLDLRAAAHRPPLASMSTEYQTPAVEDRAVEVQTLLATSASTVHRRYRTWSWLQPPNLPDSPFCTWTRTST